VKENAAYVMKHQLNSSCLPPKKTNSGFCKIQQPTVCNIQFEIMKMSFENESRKIHVNISSYTSQAQIQQVSQNVHCSGFFWLTFTIIELTTPCLIIFNHLHNNANEIHRITNF